MKVIVFKRTGFLVSALSRGPTVWGNFGPRERLHSEDVAGTDRHAICETQ